MDSPPSRPPALSPSIDWPRVGRLALLAVLGVIVLLYIRPVVHSIQQRGTAAPARADLRQLPDEHASLTLRLHQVSGRGALERQAREMGMIKQGERAYV